jgi:hypothetical protein
MSHKKLSFITHWVGPATTVEGRGRQVNIFWISLKVLLRKLELVDFHPSSFYALMFLIYK